MSDRMRPFAARLHALLLENQTRAAGLS